MNKITLIFPYFCNPNALKYQLGIWVKLPDGHEVIIVDDGSPKGQRAEEVIAPFNPLVSIYRILTNVEWNVGGARNLGVKQARNEWVLFTDIDHIVTPELLKAVQLMDLQPQNIYTFRRKRHLTGEDCGEHQETKLMTRSMYWDLGGHDESLTGIYAACDGDFVRKCRTRTIVQTGLFLEHIEGGFIPDCRCPDGTRKDKPGYAEDRNLFEQWRTMNHQPHTLRLPWAKVRG